MPEPHRDNAWSGIGLGWSVTATMVAGILVWGGLGYLVDRLVGTDGIFVGIGVVAGAAASVYLVYLRYGRTDSKMNDLSEDREHGRNDGGKDGEGTPFG